MAKKKVPQLSKIPLGQLNMLGVEQIDIKPNYITPTYCFINVSMYDAKSPTEHGEVFPVLFTPTQIGNIPTVFLEGNHLQEGILYPFHTGCWNGYFLKIRFTDDESGDSIETILKATHTKMLDGVHRGTKLPGNGYDIRKFTLRPRIIKRLIFSA